MTVTIYRLFKALEQETRITRFGGRPLLCIAHLATVTVTIIISIRTQSDTWRRLNKKVSLQLKEGRPSVRTSRTRRAHERVTARRQDWSITWMTFSRVWRRREIREKLGLGNMEEMNDCETRIRKTEWQHVFTCSVLIWSCEEANMYPLQSLIM